MALGLGFQLVNCEEDIISDQCQGHRASQEGQAESLNLSPGMSSSGSQGAKEKPGKTVAVQSPSSDVTHHHVSSTSSSHLIGGFRTALHKLEKGTSVRKAHLTGSTLAHLALGKWDTLLASQDSV